MHRLMTSLGAFCPVPNSEDQKLALSSVLVADHTVAQVSVSNKRTTTVTTLTVVAPERMEVASLNVPKNTAWTPSSWPRAITCSSVNCRIIST